MQAIEDYMLPCLNKKLFGVECMGCGMQRSVSLLLQGHFTEAFHMYPAIYTLILLFGIIAYNSFKDFKNANKIILTLAILNAIIIIGNFLIKTL
ncbi:DUF2752 domain-containing protein [Snuella lapsa]|uniref:DUF2752 domain-containing protein n=1 Tax=Snuella lapsa TaxID=870481 RepID=A0ABP6YB18_9FLAO